MMMQPNLPPTPRQSALVDQHGRLKRKLRVSLTDRCNFRCPYCLPENPTWLAKEALLTDAERLQVLQIFVRDLGISALRLTGGEPLLRNDIIECIQSFNTLRTQGLERISLTTNGMLLAKLAPALKAVGVDDINVSLDALTPATFLQLSGGRGSVEQVISGILAARDAGLKIKINTVALKGYNDAELLPLVQFAQNQQLDLRFIEYMPLDSGGNWSHDRVLREAEILAQLTPHFSVEAEPETSDPARYYRMGSQRIGIISTISRPFCKRCDRLRLTTEGHLYSCLFSAQGLDLKSLIRQGANDAELHAAINKHVWHKQSGYAASGYVERPITMHALGG